MSESRFADTGQELYNIATHYIVECPKCEKKAWIRKHGDSWRLNCTSCFYVEDEGRWYGDMTATVSVKCRECYTSIFRQAPLTNEWKKLKTECPKCGDVCEYEASISKHLSNNGQMTDRVFGLPLWLQTTIHGNVLWAYHYEHLQMLEDFISAKLRERGISPRNTLRKNSTIFSRLPVFIQQGNREVLLKSIHELQIK